MNGTYNNEIRISEFRERTKEALILTRAGKQPEIIWHQPLGLLVASIYSNRRKTVVLDFGGGVGLGFVELLAKLPVNAEIQYHVIDLEGMCVAGKQIFADDQRINFHTSLPTLDEEVNIVYVSSVLPYIEDYSGLLKQLAAYNASYILLTQLAAGAFPTYAAKQLNLSGQVLPYWFLNLGEVVEIVTTSGYSLVYEGQAGPEYNQSNYPESHRIGRMYTLLFACSKS
jgi:putative methyltransferase (TIGR04325 family)